MEGILALGQLRNFLNENIQIDKLSFIWMYLYAKINWWDSAWVVSVSEFKEETNKLFKNIFAYLSPFQKQARAI